MKHLYLSLLAVFLLMGAHAQRFSLNDLVSYTGYTPAHFETYITKKGYRSNGFQTASEGLSFTWHDKKSEVDAEKTIFKLDGEDRASIGYETTSIDDFNELSTQLKSEGYHIADSANTDLYQKGNLTVRPEKKQVGDKTIYSFNVERKALPKAKDIATAEDFLQLTSHEYLASVFGEANVKSDRFYFSEKDVSRCSVLFPNTSMQVIFIWNDEKNLRDPAFLLVGGQLQAQSSLSYHKQIEQNVWQSKQGIYSGMSLSELQRLNGKPISIHGWQSDAPGVVSQKNNGAIDFQNMHLVLNCLDCNEDGYYSNNEVLQSDDVLREGRRVYVSTIIMLPAKK